MSKLGRASRDRDSPRPCSDNSGSAIFPETTRDSTKGSPALPLPHHRHTQTHPLNICSRRTGTYVKAGRLRPQNPRIA